MVGIIYSFVERTFNFVSNLGFGINFGLTLMIGFGFNAGFKEFILVVMFPLSFLQLLF